MIAIRAGQKDASSIKAQEEGPNFSPDPFGYPSTGHVGEPGFQPSKGLIMGAAARSLARLSLEVWPKAVTLGAPQIHFEASARENGRRLSTRQKDGDPTLILSAGVGEFLGDWSSDQLTFQRTGIKAREVPDCAAGAERGLEPWRRLRLIVDCGPPPVTSTA
jgi:hypothetical protein